MELRELHLKINSFLFESHQTPNCLYSGFYESKFIKDLGITDESHPNLYERIKEMFREEADYLYDCLYVPDEE